MMLIIVNAISFALSAFALFLAAVFVNRRLVKQNKELLGRLKESESNFMYARNTIRSYQSLCNLIPDPDYVRRYDTEYFKIDKSDRWVSVVKVYGNRRCIVKIFTDSDQDFNRREAEELVEKLNEK